MRIVVHGQQAFGKAVLERLLERNENVVGVFCAPDREGRPTDPLKEFALERDLPVHQPTSWKTDEALELMRSFDPDLCVMAYVTLLVPQRVLDAPEARHDPVPSLAAAEASRAELDQLADHPGRDRDRAHHLLARRGLGRGPDPAAEGGRDRAARHARQPVLQPAVPDGRRRHDGGDRSGARGQGAADPAGRRQATYESWCRKADARIDWSKPASEVYNLIRGTDPQPGAWTLIDGHEVQIYDSAPSHGSGAPGTVLAVADDSFEVGAQGGSIVVKRVRPQGGKKMAAGEFAKAAGLKEGARLGG